MNTMQAESLFTELTAEQAAIVEGGETITFDYLKADKLPGVRFASVTMDKTYVLRPKLMRAGGMISLNKSFDIASNPSIRVWTAGIGQKLQNISLSKSDLDRARGNRRLTSVFQFAGNHQYSLRLTIR